MPVLDYMMSTDVVTSKGQRLEELGQELQDLMKKCDTTIDTLVSAGMIGKVQSSLTTAYGAVQPGMTQQMDKIDVLGSAVKKVAANTTAMADDVASKITAQ